MCREGHREIEFRVDEHGKEKQKESEKKRTDRQTD